MATMLLSRPSHCLYKTGQSKTSLSKAGLSQTSPAKTGSFAAWGMLNMTTPDKKARASLAPSAPRMSISRWSPVQQARLLAHLALISQDNKGWILVANAPAPLSRQALIKAGINPARVIEAKQASAKLLEQAMSSASIAAVVCWKGSQVMSSTLSAYKKLQYGVTDQSLRH